MVTKFNVASLLADCVITSLGESITCIENWRLLTSIIYALISFILGLVFILPNGWQMVLNTHKAIETSSIVILPFIVSQKSGLMLLISSRTHSSHLM